MHWLKLVIWWFAIQKFNDGATETPDVRRRCGTRKLNHFRSHPVRSAYNTGFVETSRLCSNTKVCKLDQALLRRKYIGTLDVPMDDTLFVEVK